MKDQSFWIIPLIRTQDGIKILEIQHIAWHWGLPKWHPEWEELPLETALREFREETWIVDIPEIIPWKSFSQSYSFINNWIEIQKTVTYFPAFINPSFNLDLQVIEIKDYKLIPYKELLNEEVPEETKKMLVEIAEFIQNRVN